MSKYPQKYYCFFCKLGNKKILRSFQFRRKKFRRKKIRWKKYFRRKKIRRRFSPKFSPVNVCPPNDIPPASLEHLFLRRLTALLRHNLHHLKGHNRFFLLSSHRFQARESRYREVVDFGKITRIKVKLGGKNCIIFHNSAKTALKYEKSSINERHSRKFLPAKYKNFSFAKVYSRESFFGESSFPRKFTTLRY